MSEFFRTSTLWVVDFRYGGSPRRWFKAFGPDVDVAGVMAARLRDLYGSRARLDEVRKASEEEEGVYLRGDAPTNVFCPTGRGGGGKAGN
ncbi:hypothetical protein [Immundisolibacter sp.]|uniref:hypothetical protein n=1 Tax=Immundisolibacter sp. TaxID=1934948 RepID=UPI003F502BBD